MSYHDVSGDHPVLEEFTKGEWVEFAQKLLMTAGYAPSNPKTDNGFNPEIDGFFGPNTKDAVVRFQTAHGLPADGVIGKETWVALEGGGSTGQLEFAQSPHIEPYNGTLNWSVKNTGSTAVTGDSSAGDYEVTDSNNVTTPGGYWIMSKDLPPGEVYEMSVNVSAQTPNDGYYRATVKLGTPSNPMVESVDFKVVDGKPQPN
jgi:hypothetical protein